MLHDVGSTLTILVVDDDKAVAELLRELLNDVSGWGATVVHAAAARAVFHHVRIEVLVLDVNLPGISGLELLELLRSDEAWKDPPIIFISAHPDQPDLERRVLAEGIRLIRKPFDVDELVTAVKDAVEARVDRASGSSTSQIGD